MHTVAKRARRGPGIEAQETPQYNPFDGKRRHGLYIEPDDNENRAEEVPRFDSAEELPEFCCAEEVPRFHRPRRILTALTKGKKKTWPVPARSHRQQTEFSHSIDEEKATTEFRNQADLVILHSEPQPSAVGETFVQESVRDILYPKFHVHWRQLKQRLGISEKGDVKAAAVADTVISFVKKAPLGTKGQRLLEIPIRQAGSILVEYFKGDPNDVRVLSLAHFQNPSEDGEKPKEQVALGLKEIASETETLERRVNLRVMYVQDDVATFEQLALDYNISSPAFNRARTRFSDWIFEENMEHLSTWQTAFWKPSYDAKRKVCRAAFGLEYLVPQFRSVAVRESQTQPSKRETKKVAYHESQDVHDNRPQRLTVYIQVNKSREKVLNLSNPDAISNLSRSEHEGRDKDLANSLGCENTIIIFDSSHNAIATDALIDGLQPWQQLVNNPNIAIAVLQLTLESIASKWSVFILHMNDYIASLEETIYAQPADDTRSGTLWGVSKQILQGERLLKFHILLLEHLQNELTDMVKTDAMMADWLRPNIEEFKRLGSEIEEMLKKPVEQMVDLMYKSISIRDARQSLKLNTSLWRLSWVTFIFLPLTFLTSFFGMNISELSQKPPLKWYFIVAAPLMVFVLISWLCVKTWATRI